MKWATKMSIPSIKVSFNKISGYFSMKMPGLHSGWKTQPWNIHTSALLHCGSFQNNEGACSKGSPWGLTRQSLQTGLNHCMTVSSPPLRPARLTRAMALDAVLTGLGLLGKERHLVQLQQPSNTQLRVAPSCRARREVDAGRGPLFGNF